MKLQNALTSATWATEHAAVLNAPIIPENTRVERMLQNFTKIRNQVGNQEYQLMSLANEKLSLEQ